MQVSKGEDTGINNFKCLLYLWRRPLSWKHGGFGSFYNACCLFIEGVVCRVPEIRKA